MYFYICIYIYIYISIPSILGLNLWKSPNEISTFSQNAGVPAGAARRAWLDPHAGTQRGPRGLGGEVLGSHGGGRGGGSAPGKWLDYLW